MNNLLKQGIKIPEDLYVVSFGDSLLSQKGNVTLTTVSVDHTKLGREALHAYSYLYRREEGVRVSIYVTPKLNVRGSTANETPINNAPKNEKFTTVVDPMYSDLSAQKLLKLEKMLASCDENDFKILNLIKSGKTYSQIADLLFMSEKTVSYRVTSLRNIMSFSTKEELARILCEYNVL